MLWLSENPTRLHESLKVSFKIFFSKSVLQVAYFDGVAKIICIAVILAWLNQIASLLYFMRMHRIWEYLQVEYFRSKFFRFPLHEFSFIFHIGAAGCNVVVDCTGLAGCAGYVDSCGWLGLAAFLRSSSEILE